ncbi:PRA1 family protein 2 [Trichinella spiralis]|uniref:PRA1 family protein 2 n=1 Tax=Trichinella spiralis TaxID=6334 RepID=UPI0001EFBE26|nr:PRA1 family protein 2 [Trichinella spiralis]
MENSQMCPLEFSPVRTLDDFLLGSARFQAPTFHDAQLGAVYITSTSQADVVKVKKDHPLVCLAIIVSSMYILFQMFDAVMFAVFALLMPALLILFHASCRLRNVRNKIENKIEALGVKKSPMGHMLEMCGLHLDLLMKD